MTIGQRVPMVDATERVTGSLEYVLDLRLAGMAEAKILRSPHAHARITRLDASRAAALPGVVAVLTGNDLRDRTDIVPTFGLFIRDQYPVAVDRVRYAGEPVAAVAARDAATAQRALELIDIDYEPLPAVFDVEAALEPDAPILHPGPRLLASARPDILARQPGFESTNVIHLFTQRRGDVAAGFARAEVVIEHTYSSPAVAHVPLEPHVCVASWSGRQLTLWDSTQAPHYVALELANLFRIRLTDVRVIVPTLGGGFGSKVDPSIEPIVALLARSGRRPVRLALTRSEEFLTHTKHAARVRIRTGALRDGTLVAHEATCWYDGGAYAKSTPEKVRRGYASMGPYRVGAVHVDSYGVYTNRIPTAGFRGYGIPQVAWAHESQMDALADELGMDPLELRLRNALLPGDSFSTGEILHEDLHLPELLRAAAEHIGWGDGPLVVRDGSTVRAKGIAAIIKGMSSFPATSVVKLNGDGSLHVLNSAIEMGQGALTALAQIAAHEATLPLGAVRVSTADTALTPWDQMTAASRTTSASGQAIRSAVRQVKEQLTAMAAQRFEIAAEDLEIVDGTVRAKGSPDKAVPFGALVRMARVGNVLGYGTFVAAGDLDVETGQGIGSPQWHPAVCAAEVTVDTETGRVTIERLHLGLYVGRMINPTQCELQVRGAALFGVGQVLFEDLVVDDAGVAVTTNLADYMIPSFLDVPRTFDETILETPDSTDAHGIGETGLPAVPPAIGNAVARALGARIRDLPLTPERVLVAAQAGRESG
jgi:CO/xanthine dehydrogenase Mo-binding subunit